VLAAVLGVQEVLAAVSHKPQAAKLHVATAGDCCHQSSCRSSDGRKTDMWICPNMTTGLGNKGFTCLLDCCWVRSWLMPPVAVVVLVVCNPPPPPPGLSSCHTSACRLLVRSRLRSSASG
jgi:hypothetical protein